VIAVSGIIAFIVHEVQQQAASLKGSNHTKRAWEAFEGRANAELVERALGEYDLDK
jgi:hypothetical protein